MQERVAGKSWNDGGKDAGEPGEDAASDAASGLRAGARHAGVPFVDTENPSEGKSVMPSRSVSVVVTRASPGIPN